MNSIQIREVNDHKYLCFFETHEEKHPASRAIFTHQKLSAFPRGSSRRILNTGASVSVYNITMIDITDVGRD